MALAAIVAIAFTPAPVAATAVRRHAPERATGPVKPDLSARKRRGKASYYARQFFGKPMANGAPMNPRGKNAASRTLPLGTVAKVTNVATGKSAIIKIEDRGPYIKGRIVDLSPSTARKIGITRRIGVAKVVVAPIAVPLPDGQVKLGGPPDHHEVPQVASSSAEPAGATRMAARALHARRVLRRNERVHQCVARAARRARYSRLDAGDRPRISPCWHIVAVE
ncbi:MAG: septal ring lytic transglycosylase RlpA family protein [Acetobacteraceae bacterium]